MPPINSKLIPFIRKTILKSADVLYDSYAWRKTENKYHALVAEIMLQRTNADQVLPVFIHFSETYQSPEDFIKKNKSNIFKSLGLPQRQKHLKELSKLLAQRSSIPVEKTELIKLPGVGDYVASAFRSLHTGQRDILVDSNIFRFYSRFFGFESNSETRRQKWFMELADKITPSRRGQNILCPYKKFNYGLLDFTRKICKVKNPICGGCELNKKCVFYHKNKLKILP